MALVMILPVSDRGSVDDEVCCEHQHQSRPPHQHSDICGFGPQRQ